MPRRVTGVLLEFESGNLSWKAFQNVTCDAVAWQLKAAYKGRRNRTPATPKKR